MSKLRSPLTGRLLNIRKYFVGETSLCWAYSIATMLRHTLSQFVNDLIPKFPMHDFSEALGYLGKQEFHKRIRDEITMIPIPKMKIKKKSPIGVKLRDFNAWVIEEQRHILELAIDRVILRYIQRLRYRIMSFDSLLIHQLWTRMG